MLKAKDLGADLVGFASVEDLKQDPFFSEKTGNYHAPGVHRCDIHRHRRRPDFGLAVILTRRVNLLPHSGRHQEAPSNGLREIGWEVPVLEGYSCALELAKLKVNLGITASGNTFPNDRPQQRPRRIIV